MTNKPKRPPGRPVKIAGARRVNAWLDEDTIDRLKLAGEGNLSEGIRKLATADTAASVPHNVVFENEGD